MLITAF